MGDCLRELYIWMCTNVRYQEPQHSYLWNEDKVQIQWDGLSQHLAHCWHVTSVEPKDVVLRTCCHCFCISDATNGPWRIEFVRHPFLLSCQNSASATPLPLPVLSPPRPYWAAAAPSSHQKLPHLSAFESMNSWNRKICCPWHPLSVTSGVLYFKALLLEGFQGYFYQNPSPSPQHCHGTLLPCLSSSNTNYYLLISWL